MCQYRSNSVCLQLHVVTQAAARRHNHSIGLRACNVGRHRRHGSATADCYNVTLAITQKLAQDVRCRAADFALDHVLLVRIARQNDNLANLQRIAKSLFQKRNILQLTYVIGKLL